jgi:transposase-like protein
VGVFDLSKQRRFLTAIEMGNTVTEAAKMVDVSRGTVYAYRKEHPEFESAIEEAKESAVDDLLSEARIRALDRRDPKSATFLIFLIKGALPEYKENYRPVETAKGKDSKIHEFTPDEMEEAMKILDSVKNEQPKTEE